MVMSMYILCGSKRNAVWGLPTRWRPGRLRSAKSASVGPIILRANDLTHSPTHITPYPVQAKTLS
eukprot:6220469-Pyramimonas_sp.AAC.1